MTTEPKKVVTDAPWIGLTYQIIGLAMEIHNELGPAHRESVYHNGMAIKLQNAGRSFESEPYVPVTLADGTVVGETAVPIWWWSDWLLLSSKLTFIR